MPLVPRLLHPRCRRATAARSLPALPGYRDGIERKFLAWKRTMAAKAAAAGLLVLLAWPGSLFGSGIKLRDLVMISGARDNQLVGYGLVAGLAGDGDKDPALHQTDRGQSAAALRHQHSVRLGPLSAKNVAVVMVTADIPPFVKNGARH